MDLKKQFFEKICDPQLRALEKKLNLPECEKREVMDENEILWIFEK